MGFVGGKLDRNHRRPAGIHRDPKEELLYWVQITLCIFLGLCVRLALMPALPKSLDVAGLQFMSPILRPLSVP